MSIAVGVCVCEGGEGGCYRGPYKFNLVYKKCLRERSWEAKWPSNDNDNDNDNDDEPPLSPRPCSTLLLHNTATPSTPTLNPFWRQLQMELEIMQLEICSARCCVKTPERVPSPPSVCLTSLCIEIQNKNLQVENLCIEKRNPTTCSPPFPRATRLQPCEKKVLQC